MRCRWLGSFAAWGVVVALMVSVVPVARGALLLQNSGPGGIQLNPDGGVPGLDVVNGYSFRVGPAPLSATALGFWDANQDGIPTPMLVGVWKNSTDTLVTSTVVPSGTAGRLLGEFRFADLASAVTLDAGELYTIGWRKGPNVTGLVQIKRGSNPTVSPHVSIVLAGLRTDPAYFLPGSTAAPSFPQFEIRPFEQQRPTSFLGDDTPLVGGNVEFTVIPEPAAAGVAGALAVLGLRRRGR